MEQVIINADTAKAKWAVELFFENYKDPVVQFVNNVIKSGGDYADAFVMKDENGVITVYQTAPDKGWVLGQQEDKSLALVAYKSVPTDTKYVLYDGQKLALFLKQAEGEPDLKLGFFQNLNDTVAQIESEPVKNALDAILAAKKSEKELDKKVEANQKKLDKKAARKEKLAKLAKNNGE